MTLTKKPIIILTLAFAILVTSCSGASTEDQNSTGEIEGSGAAAFDLLSELQSSGAAVERAEEISQPFFTVEGRIFRVNDVDVQVFEYADAAAAQEESTMISSDGSSVGTSMITWMDAPHFYLKDRFIVLYVGSDSATTETLAEVLGAQFAGR